MIIVFFFFYSQTCFLIANAFWTLIFFLLSSLGDNQLGDEGIELLAAILPHSTSLHTLLYSTFNLFICITVFHKTVLIRVQLNLQHSDVHIDWATHLLLCLSFDSFQLDFSVLFISLYDNNIGVHGSRILSQSLSSCPTLSSLL